MVPLVMLFEGSWRFGRVGRTREDAQGRRGDPSVHGEKVRPGVAQRRQKHVSIKQLVRPVSEARRACH